MKFEFDKTKAALSKDLHLELEYRRQQQALLIRNKLLSLKLGPISSVSLEKMRRDAHKMVKDQQLLTPLKTPAWFSKLERVFGKRGERFSGCLGREVGYTFSHQIRLVMIKRVFIHTPFHSTSPASSATQSQVSATLQN